MVRAFLGKEPEEQVSTPKTVNPHRHLHPPIFFSCDGDISASSVHRLFLNLRRNGLRKQVAHDSDGF